MICFSKYGLIYGNQQGERERTFNPWTLEAYTDIALVI